MDIYHIWCDKAGDMEDEVWVGSMEKFFDRLVKEKRMVKYRITRMKLGFRSIADLPE